MKITTTFVEGLYAVKYHGEVLDELERLLDEWMDIEKLSVFFEDNSADLKYFHLDVDQAIIETRKEAASLRKKLINLTLANNPELESLFVNLDDREFRIIELAKQKSKRRWLRLYAIRVDKDTFVITGGAIKLTHKMEERHHTFKELLKLDICWNYLKSQGVFDLDSFNELII